MTGIGGGFAVSIKVHNVATERGAVQRTGQNSEYQRQSVAFGTANRQQGILLPPVLDP